MGRIFENINSANAADVKSALDTLVADRVTVSAYRNAFFSLGRDLGNVIRERFESMGKVLLVCASEDADWLAKGLQTAFTYKLSLAVFWSKRILVCEDPKIELSPIVKSYIEPDACDCDTMIIVKSIISTSCVVKTQINYLIDRVNPERIIIAAPVMYKDAQSNLEAEFPVEISSKFVYCTFAIDDQRDESTGAVIPGVGGMVYGKLGLGGILQKNSYMPQIVKERAFGKPLKPQMACV